MINNTLKTFIKIVYKLQSLYQEKIMVCSFDYIATGGYRDGFIVIDRSFYVRPNIYTRYIIDYGANSHKDYNFNIGDSYKYNYFKKLFDKLLKIKRQ